MYYLSIDTGTTNTRATVWDEETEVYTAFRPVGVRMTSIEGNNHTLVAAIRECVEESLKSSNISFQELGFIAASGMITSNLGVCEVPHIKVPASVQQLAEGTISKVIPEITLEKEIYFVPGIKNFSSEVTLDNCEAKDIMRGEETETVGVMQRCRLKGPAILILPGSHTKFVFVDNENRITDCSTTMAGEFLMNLTQSSVLSESLSKEFAEELDEKWLLKGAQICKQFGLGQTAFKVRILDLFSNASINQKANFLLGAVLEQDIIALKKKEDFIKNPECKEVIVGNSLLASAFEKLLKADDSFLGKKIRVLGKKADNLAGFGSGCIVKWLIAQKRIEKYERQGENNEQYSRAN